MQPSRTLRAVLAATSLLVALVAGCADDPPANEPVAVWSEAFDTSGTGSLSGVWGTGPDDVFIVGGSEAGGEVYHYDGATWAPMDLPDGVPLLVWVYGFGPDDVYSVGVDGAVVHYDGAAWTALDSGVEDDLWGVFGFGPDDLWIVGGDANGDAPVILHYDGNVFEAVEVSASENPRDAKALFKVWGIDGRLFAVGQAGWILEYVDGEWLNRPAGAEANQDFVSLWGTGPDDIVVAGGRSNARIAEWDGVEFTTVSPSRLGGLNAVFVPEPGTAIVGGVFGFVGAYDTETNEVSAEDSPGGADSVHAVWGDGAGRTYAVGGSFFTPHRGLAWVRTVE